MTGHQLDCWYEPKKEGDKNDPWETPAFTPVYDETCPTKVTLCFLSFKKSDKTLSSLPEIPFCFSLKLIYQTLLRHQEKHLSLQTRYQKIYIFRVDKSCLIQESPGLKLDWFDENKLFSIRNWTFPYILVSQVFFHKLEAVRLVDSFSNIVYHLSYEFGLNWLFFHSNGKESMSIHWMKIRFKVLQTDLPQIFIMQILILSWPWALFGSKFCMIISISLLKKFRVSKRFSVVNEGWEGVHYYYLSKKIVLQRRNQKV